MVLVVASGLWNRNASQAKLKEWTDTQSVPVVSVISPATGDNKSSLDLPGRLEAYARAPIYARVSGFLKAWYVDIGAPVKAGQLLAEIEAPDLDQQLLQAKAALASAQAAETLAAVTAQRWQTLGGTNTVAKQTVDEKTGDLTVKQALTRAAKANVDRLEVLCRLQAPDGAVRRHRDGPQHRCRRADQRRIRAPASPCSSFPTRRSSGSMSASRRTTCRR